MLVITAVGWGWDVVAVGGLLDGGSGRVNGSCRWWWAAAG